MNVFQLMGVGFSTVLNPIGIALMFVGVAVGIVFGALPGLSATMAIALFLPVTMRAFLPTRAASSPTLRETPRPKIRLTGRL